jgi:hypothetical protein
MSLTINQAARKYKSGDLSWSDYLDQILPRLAGDGHEEDEEEPAGLGLLEHIDPFASYIYTWSKDMEWWLGRFHTLVRQCAQAADNRCPSQRRSHDDQGIVRELSQRSRQG